MRFTIIILEIVKTFMKTRLKKVKGYAYVSVLGEINYITKFQIILEMLPLYQFSKKD